MSGMVDIAKSIGVKQEVVSEVFEEILKRVDNGEEVRIKGFGTFKGKIYPGRTLQSPTVNDGKPIKFGDSVTLKFRQSQLAKQHLNKPKPKAAAKGKSKSKK